MLGGDPGGGGRAMGGALWRGLEAGGAAADGAGVLSPPAIACLTRLLGYDAGVVISASHNPYRDNGIKVFSGRGEKLSDRLEMEIERQVLDGDDPRPAAASGPRAASAASSGAPSPGAVPPRSAHHA